jgi:hypothetical protein
MKRELRVIKKLGIPVLFINQPLPIPIAIAEMTERIIPTNSGKP